MLIGWHSIMRKSFLSLFVSISLNSWFFFHSICCSSWLLITVHFTQIIPELASSSLFMYPFDICVTEGRGLFFIFPVTLKIFKACSFLTLVLESAISLRSPSSYWWEASKNMGSWWTHCYWGFLASRPLVDRAGNMCIWI